MSQLDIKISKKQLSQKKALQNLTLTQEQSTLKNDTILGDSTEQVQRHKIKVDQ